MNAAAVIVAALLLVIQMTSSTEQKTITVESGQNITLPCRAPNNNIRAVEWSRADLEDEYVLLYRDGHFELSNQHPSFKNRVDLQDRWMKDGDVSLILKDVTINDTGTYECGVFTTGTNDESISIIYLSVAPPGPTGGRPGLFVGLAVSVLLLVAAVSIVMSIKQKKKNSPLPPPGDEETTDYCGFLLRTTRV